MNVKKLFDLNKYLDEGLMMFRLNHIRKTLRFKIINSWDFCG